MATDEGIHSEVEEPRKFDEKDKAERRALLPLNGNVAGYHLAIIKPAVGQLAMRV